MKKLPFLLAALFFLIFSAQAQNSRKGLGAATFQELGQAVFNALQQNQFNNLAPFMPGDAELKILKRRSSEDMRLVLERTSPDSIRQNLQRDFNYIMEQGTAATFNWSEYQPTNIKPSRRDRKNPLLYRLEITLAHATGAESTLFIETVKIRGRHFLFKQMVFQPKK